MNREPSTFEELGQDANTRGFGRMYPQDPNETDLQLGVGDTLLVTVEDAENLTGPRVIRQDGKITLPVIGDVMAAGLTSTEIQKKVETLLAVYLHEPKVTVAVETVVSKRYFVGSLNPSTGGATFLAVPYEGDTTLFDAWVGMGSPATPLDDDCHVKVIRGGVRNPRVMVVNIREMYTLGYTGGNIQIRPDDIIVVPPTLLGYIARFVAGVSAPFESFFRVTSSIARIQYSIDSISGDTGGRYGRGYTF
jgi:polysaccharide export outer membrane protein